MRLVPYSICVVIVAACSGGPSPASDDDVEPDAAQPQPDAPPQVGDYTTTPDCPDAADAIYISPAQLPAQRGALVRCSLGSELQVADVQAKLDDADVVLTAQTGVRVVKLSYRTERSNGSPALSSATVYLPLVPRALPVPIVLIGRSTSGIADSCAPSKDALPQDDLALPFAARGFIAITPDFAGLGTEGTHSYLDNHDAALQLFDAALAVAALEPAGVVGDAVGAAGYSQGGGVVLSAQALEHATTGKHTLRGVAAIAPEWPISSRSFGYEDVLRNPDRLTGLAGLAPPTVTVLRHYGFLINRMGMTGGEAFPSGERSSITSSIESLCTVPLGGALGAQQLRLGELVDETFRLQVLACIDGTAGCTGLGQAFHQWMTSDFVTADAAGARVLIVQGLADQVMPAAGEAACGVAKLRAEGIEPDLCTDTTATHESVLEKRIGNAVAWIEALVDGASPPACSSQTLPACNR
jgi:hypothetical protein